MKSILIAVLLFTCYFLIAQPGSMHWEHRFGGKSQDVFHHVLEASNGYLIAVGETHSNTNGGSDGLLLILDYSTGQTVVEKKIGGNKADGFYTAIQTYDGHFLLAGYTESVGFGKRDAWLVKIDEKGHVVWKKSFGSSADDYFKQLLTLSDGEIVAIGQKNGGKDGNIWIAKIQEQSIIKEWQIGAGVCDKVAGAVLSRDGHIAILGNTSKNATAGKGDVFLTKIDIEGRHLWTKTFGDREWEEAGQVIATPDGGFALAGTTASTGAGAMDMWMVKVNSGGFKQWEQTYGGKDEDWAQTLALSSNGGYFLGGHSKSYHSGARSFKGFIVKTNSGGQRQWEWNYGGNKDDAFNQLKLLHDGSILVIGNTASNTKGDDDAWIFRFTDSNQNAFASFVGVKETAIEHSVAILNTTDGKLRPEERSFLSFTVFNQHNVELSNIEINVEKQQGSDGIQCWQQNYFGSIRPGENKEIRIPVKGTANLNSAQNDFNISIKSGQKELANFQVSIESLQPQSASIEINNHNFEDSRTSDKETLNIIVHNPGDFVARSVRVQFRPPAGIQAISPLSITLSQLAGHASQNVVFTYKRTTAYRSASLAIPCTIDFNGQKINKTLTRSAGLNQEVFMVLTQPNETKTDLQNIISSKDVFDVQVAVGSSSVLQQKNFRVLNNNMVIDGSKMDEVDLTAKNNQSNQNAYVYSNKIHLNPGENRLEIEVETADGTFKTKTIIVTYEPQQPNLHILAIGPSHQDLSYTSKDAADFAAAFTHQGGDNKIYGKVFIRTMVTPEDTEASDIREAIADLVYQYENPTAAQRIQEQDVLLVFISSHGKNNREGFQLLPSNYDPKYERIRSIDFQRDIMQELTQIACKKVIFIDACHSGAADSKELTDIARAKALSRLAALHPGLNTLSSCGASEMSYEDAAWENGAFTEAILEAFANKMITEASGNYSCDANKDSIITLAELYDFLRQRVPQLVQSQKQSAPTRQSPFMPINDMDAQAIPIFVVD